MKQDKILTIVLAIANIVLIVFCVVIFLQTDRTEPKFEFGTTDVIYRSGMEEARLLDGITSKDNKDGDITDRIVIEKFIENEEESTVVVYYAVSDKAGNVAKCSRVFPAILAVDKTEAKQDAEELMEAGVQAELEDKEALEKQVEEVTETQEDAEVTPSPTPEATATPTPEPEVTPESEEQQEVAAPQPAAPAVNPAAPILTLNTGQIVVQRGMNPPWVNSISVLKDDKDSYETLFYNLKFSKYSVNEPGSYPVTIYTEDSDGNQSAPVSVTIIVK